jgi:tRNA(Ile)-lysidine synthase
MKVKTTFKSFLENHPAICYFVACSGGVDSMVLLHLAQKTKIQIHVLHVNYNLRGQDSIDDAKFIEEYCLLNCIPFSIHSVELGIQLRVNGGNLQNEARKIRYAFFQQKLKEIPESKLLTGQHLNDQIETFWLQLYRGSGMKGMAGMSFERNNILRPLLSIEKGELIAYAIQNKLNWREDISNSKSDYQRNKWRNEYLPELRKTLPDIDESVLLIQSVFERNLELIESKINFLAELIKKNQFIQDYQVNDLQLTELAELFRKLCIPIKMIVPFANLFHSQKGSKIEWRNIHSKKQEIIREKDGFYFNKISKEKNIPEIITEMVKELPTLFDKKTFYFSPDKIKGNIVIRLWEKGDRIYPIGLSGSKLISDVLTDSKIPHSKRNYQWVLCDDEKILACIGFCIDRRAIAKDDTSILKITFKK